jgi:hypothetical protein
MGTLVRIPLYVCLYGEFWWETGELISRVPEISACTLEIAPCRSSDISISDQLRP